MKLPNKEKRIGGRELFDALCKLIGQQDTVNLYKEFEGRQIYIVDVESLIYTETEAAVYEEYKRLSELYSPKIVLKQLSRSFDLVPEVIIKTVKMLKRLELRGREISKGQSQTGLYNGNYGGKGISIYTMMCKVIGIDKALVICKLYKGKTLYFLRLKNALINERNRAIYDEYVELKDRQSLVDHDLHVHFQRKYGISWMRIREIIENEKTQ